VVYATPVDPNFTVAHQWVRELKRNGIRTMVAIQFRIPDDEVVRVGRYGTVSLEMTAAQAIAAFKEQGLGLGHEILKPRKIKASELVRSYVPRQLIGWRYSPESLGKKPCGCEWCQRGNIKGRKLRERYEATWK